MNTVSLFGQEATAVISPCGLYRYSLTRTWDEDRPRVCFVMLNPSTADAAQDDPTLRKCKGFARSWGYGSLEVVNLFAYRATDPRDLRKVAAPIGAENDAYIDAAVSRAARVVAAWGVDGAYLNRDLAVLLRVPETWCLKITKDGFPWHPLYVAGNAELVTYWGQRAT